MKMPSEEITPPWFVSFELRLEQRFDGLSRSLDDIVVRLVEHDEKLKSLSPFKVTKYESWDRETATWKRASCSKAGWHWKQKLRNNLVFFGMPEIDKKDCTVSVKDMSTNFIGVDPSVMDHILTGVTGPQPFVALLSVKKRNQELSTSRFHRLHLETLRKACMAKFKLRWKTTRVRRSSSVKISQRGF